MADDLHKHESRWQSMGGSSHVDRTPPVLASLWTAYVPAECHIQCIWSGEGVVQIGLLLLQHNDRKRADMAQFPYHLKKISFVRTVSFCRGRYTVKLRGKTECNFLYVLLFFMTKVFLSN